MRKPLTMLIAGLALAGLAGGTARSDEKPGTTAGTTAIQGDEAKKHLSAIDVYLRDAMNHAKVLHETSQMAPGKVDSAIQREGIAHIDQAISAALMHVNHLKTMPEAAVSDAAKLEMLQKELMQARAVMSQLRSAARNERRDEITSLAARAFMRLKDADDSFGALADKQGLTRVDKIMVPEKQPVGGKMEEEKDGGGGETVKPAPAPPEPQSQPPKRNY